MEIIDTVNVQIGTHFPVDSNWQDIFKKEASLPNDSEVTHNNEADWPSDDSKDDDYDPEMNENSGGSSRSVSGGGDNDGESISISLSLASDGVELSTGSWEGHSNMVELCETSNEETTVCGPRQRRTVDYTKLYYEMFGKDAILQEQGSEDEDWGPSDRRRKKESDAAREQSERDLVSVEDRGGRRPMFRLPRAAVEKLRQVFAENELPSKAVRDSLLKELSLETEKVSKWFKNARYLSMRNMKMEIGKQPEDSKTVSGDSGPKSVMENNTETYEIQNIVVETVPLGLYGSATNQKTVYPCNNNQEEIRLKDSKAVSGYSVPEAVMENKTETDEIEDTVDETVSFELNDFAMNKKTISPHKSNQKEIKKATVSFPTLTDESQQYLELQDSSLTLV